jgi:hypothetical protein
MRLNLLGLVLMLSTFGAVAQQLEEMQFGRVYNAGTRVNSSALGVSLVIPESWQGGVANATSFAMTDTSRTRWMLAIAQVGASIQDVATWLNTPQNAGNGVMMQPVGQAVIQRNRLSQRFTGGGFVWQAISLMGAADQGLTLIALGAPDQQTQQALLERTINSVKFSQAQATVLLQQWNTNLRGKQLYLFDYSSTGNTKTGTDTTREATWQLCSNGQYAFSGNVQTSLNITITDPSDSSNWTDRLGQAGLNASNHTGRWKVVMIGAQTTLLLMGSDGLMRGHALFFDGRNLKVDGLSASINPSSQCR